MKNIYRKKIESVTVNVEQQYRPLFLEKDLRLKEIGNILKTTGHEELLSKLEQAQYEIDDAMYIAIYQQGVKDLYRFQKNKKEFKKLGILA